MSNAAQQEELKKRIAIGVFGALFLGIGVYVYTQFFATSAPAVTAPPVITSKNPTEGGAPGTSSSASSSSSAQQVGLGAAPGVAAKRMASTSSSLDPTLDETAMLRTESLVYSGTGRNIFSLTYVAPGPDLSKIVTPPARPAATGPPPPPPKPAYQPPPIDLKYFGVEIRSDGTKQAFLSHKDDIYLASKGDIVARIYKIGEITERNVEVEDLQNHTSKTLPLETN